MINVLLTGTRPVARAALSRSLDGRLAERLGLRRPQQRRELGQFLGVGGAVLPDRGGERLLVGVDELLFVAGLDGEEDPGQVGGLSAVGVGDGHRDLRLVGGGADRIGGADRLLPAVHGLDLLDEHALRLREAVAVLRHARGPGPRSGLHLSVVMLASGPFWTALSQFCMIVEHFSSAVCSAAGGLGGLAVGGGTSMPSSLSADPGCSRKPYCSASAVPRYPQPPQGCANDRFRGLRLMAIGTLPLLALSGYPAAVMHATARAKSDSPGASPSLLDWPSAA